MSLVGTELLQSRTSNEQSLADLLHLASQICGTPVSAICFFGEAGFILKDNALSVSALLNDAVFKREFQKRPDLTIISDLSQSSLHFVKKIQSHDTSFRFYAGLPILGHEGSVVGFLCVLDQKERSLSARQVMGLEALGRQASTLFELKEEIADLKKNQDDKSSEISDRKLIAAKLDKQKQFYESILNKLPIDIAVFDPDHKYLFVNPGAIGNDEFRRFIIGKDDYEYAAFRNRDVSVAHARRKQFLQVKNTGKEIRWEDTLPDPKGNMITHLRRMYPVHDEHNELSMVIGFGLDITDRKKMEEEQATLVTHLSNQNTQLTDFCNIVSHNLRGPLVNMSMLVEFIEECEDPEEQKMLISKLSPVLTNLHTTFNELVESIQIKHNLEVQVEDINLIDSTQRTLDALEAEISQLDAQVTYDYSEVSMICFPSKYIHSIIHNLISNSLKYHSPDRKPVIKLSTQMKDDKILFSITDNGLGIDLKKHKDNFFKIGKVFHKHPNAKGFGLFMTKTQIEAMGGKIWLDSVPDEGTTFFIEFINQRPCNRQ